jgi:hypothetical protein
VSGTGTLADRWRAARPPVSPHVDTTIDELTTFAEALTAATAAA